MRLSGKRGEEQREEKVVEEVEGQRGSNLLHPPKSATTSIRHDERLRDVLASDAVRQHQTATAWP